MTTERPTYNANAYVSDRPPYPERVFEILAAYHEAGNGGFGHAIDLGCGPGFMALELSKTFEKVSGLDPEEGMVKAGLQPEGKRISYHVGTAEDLGAVGIEDNSVDLVIAGEAAHYFDHSVTWPELARVLRPSGTVCWAGYGRLTIAGNDAANAVIAQFMDETLAGHWSEPGWSISEGLYDRIPFPITPAYTQATEELIATLPDLTGDGHPIQAKIAEPTPTGGAGWDATSAIRLKSGTTAGQWYLRQSWTPRQLERIFRTWSSVKRYQDHQPTDRSAKLDVVGRVMAELTPLLGDQFAVVWPFVLMMIRRDALA